MVRSVSFADVDGPFRGGNAYDMISPHRRAASPEPIPGPETVPAEQTVLTGNPTGVILGGIGALFIIGYLIKSTAGLSSEVGFLTTPIYWLTTVFGVMIGIVVIKVITARWPIPGVTPVVHLV